MSQGKSKDHALIAISGYINIKHRYETLPIVEVERIRKFDQRDAFFTDSGASAHMIHRREWFSEYRPRNDGSTVSLGDDGECTVAGEGTVLIQRLVHGEWKAGRIENVLYVPGMRKNLLSIGVWDRKGYKVVFKQQEVRI